MESPQRTERPSIRRRILGRSIATLALASSLLTASTNERECQLISQIDAFDEIDQTEFDPIPQFEQDFENMTTTELDQEVWTFDLRYMVPTWNEGVEMGYTNLPENVRIEPGVGLIIEARRRQHIYEDDPEQIEREITSGRINTSLSFAAPYGRFEMVAKMPNGDGTWAAFWLLSQNNPHGRELNPEDFQNDKRFFLKRGGEGDIEYYGKNPNVITGTTHTYNRSETGCAAVPNLSNEFHVFALELTPDRMLWTVDGKPFHMVKAYGDSDDWPFTDNNGEENLMYIIVNLAMGGDGGEIDSSRDSWQFIIKNIKHYPMTEQLSD